MGLARRRCGGRRAQSARTVSPGRKQNALTSFLPSACCVTLRKRCYRSGPGVLTAKMGSQKHSPHQLPLGAPRKVVALLAMATLTQADCAVGHRGQSPAGSPALPQPPSPGEPASWSEGKNSILGRLLTWGQIRPPCMAGWPSSQCHQGRRWPSGTLWPLLSRWG